MGFCVVYSTDLSNHERLAVESLSSSNSFHHNQHQHDQHQKAKTSTWPVAPTAAMRPCGECAKQHEHENNQKYGTQHWRSPESLNQGRSSVSDSPCLAQNARGRFQHARNCYAMRKGVLDSESCWLQATNLLFERHQMIDRKPTWHSGFQTFADCGDATTSCLLNDRRFERGFSPGDLLTKSN